MNKALSAGDVVICRYYNTPDHRFYGEFFEARILLAYTKTPDGNRPIQPGDNPDDKRYEVLITEPNHHGWNQTVILRRKEIRRRAF